MKNRALPTLLLFLLAAVSAWGQGAMKELYVEVDPDCDQVFYRSEGGTAQDAFVVVYSTIPDLSFEMPDTPKRLRNTPSFDEKNSRYVLCVKPTDEPGTGGITKYSIDVSAPGCKPATFVVADISVGQCLCFTIVALDPAIALPGYQPKPPLPKHWFVLGQWAYTGTQHSVGFTVGHDKGWFVSLMSGFQYPHVVGDWSSSSQYVPAYDNAKAHTRFSLTAGAALRLARFLQLKVGVGYGVNNLYWQSRKTDWYRVPHGSYRGLDVSLGLQSHLGPVTLAADMVSTQFKTLEVKTGLGINF